MKIGSIIELKVNDEYYLSKGIEKGAQGVIAGDNQDELSVIFFNEHNVGDYAVCNVSSMDVEETGYTLPLEFLSELDDVFGTLKKQSAFTTSEFNEYDDIEVVVEKEEYSEYGVHKGMRGVIMESYAINNQWYVIFTDENTGCDIADICIDEKDMIKLK